MSERLKPQPSHFVFDRLTGRDVLLRDPTGQHPVLSMPFHAYELSVRELRGHTLLHVCRLADGVRIEVPPDWVCTMPANVVPFRRAP